ncbi:hypothetical protein GGI35DRAFT_490479 [Trichoderma velutinum]
MAAMEHELSKTQLPVNHISASIDAVHSPLWDLSQTIYKNPELGFKETIAHDAITKLLAEEGFTVKPHAYGLTTSFEAEFGSGGRLVIYCAEYDALPDIGHACGHNLIAVTSVAAFISLARALKDSAVEGRVRILGTPAEEGLGGKIKLLQAGAFAGDVAAALMMHPTAAHSLPSGVMGNAGTKLIANVKLQVQFKGKPAHAGAAPWNGLNALDAAVATYTNVSMLRQHIRPDERINVIIEDGGKAVNIIPETSRMVFSVRAPTWGQAHALTQRVRNCFEAAATATGCTFTDTELIAYKDLRINDTLSNEYTNAMAAMGIKFVARNDKPFTASTDMGNVSYAVPSFHGGFGVPVRDGATLHQEQFAEAAGSLEAFEIAMQCAKGLSLLGWRVLHDDNVAVEAMKDFNEKE